MVGDKIKFFISMDGLNSLVGDTGGSIKINSGKKQFSFKYYDRVRCEVILFLDKSTSLVIVLSATHSLSIRGLSLVESYSCSFY